MRFERYFFSPHMTTTYSQKSARTVCSCRNQVAATSLLRCVWVAFSDVLIKIGLHFHRMSGVGRKQRNALVAREAVCALSVHIKYI